MKSELRNQTATVALAAVLLLGICPQGSGQPVIVTEPQNQTGIAGTTATFSVEATGTEPLSYQWRSYANTTQFTNIPGATTPVLMLANVQPTNRRFGVEVSNPAGAVTSRLATLTVLVPPTISTQSAGGVAFVGGALTLSVMAAGTAPLTYQWRFNDADIPGATASSLVLSSVQLTNAGTYTVVVANAAGMAASQPITLSVFPRPFIAEWNAIAFQHLDTLGNGRRPLTRGMAMVHVAQFDAVNSVLGGYTPYLLNTAAPNASPEAAAVQAAYGVLTNLVPGALSPLASSLNSSLQAIPNGPAKTGGIALGQYAAEAIILLRARDGSTLSVPYTPTVVPGSWRPTLPGFTSATGVNWPYVTPWALASSSQFRLPPPPALNSVLYTRDFMETRDYGRAGGSSRTPEQTELAAFHGGSTELTHLMGRVAITNRPLSLMDSARFFALLSMASADTYVADFETRYTYNHWRPITAIREADTDGNSATDPDPSWTPLFDTPNFPEYPSGTASSLGSAVEVLAAVFGDQFTFTVRNSMSATAHSYTRFSDVATEGANARIWAGAHWRNSCEAGLALGRAVARHVLQNFLRPGPALAGQLQNGEFRIGTAARSTPDYAIQYSADLVNWLPLPDHLRTAVTLQVLDPGAGTNGHRFYRAVLPAANW